MFNATLAQCLNKDDLCSTLKFPLIIGQCWVWCLQTPDGDCCSYFSSNLPSKLNQEGRMLNCSIKGWIFATKFVCVYLIAWYCSGLEIRRSYSRKFAVYIVHPPMYSICPVFVQSNTDPHTIDIVFFITRPLRHNIFIKWPKHNKTSKFYVPLHFILSLIFPCTLSQSPWFFLWAGYYVF
jgi:hypothetical protein